MLRNLRRALALLCFIPLSLLFLDFSGVVHPWLGWLAKLQFLPALLALNLSVLGALLLATLLLGRVYCSTLCPLGILQDLVSWIASRRKKNRFVYLKARPVLRYGVLFAFALSLIVGASSVVALLDPYSAYGRILSSLASPFTLWGNNLLASLSERFNSYAFNSVDVWLKSASTLAIASTTFLVIALLSWKYGRLYCNTICPVGTFLGFVSRFALLKIRIDHDTCNGCGLCARNCKASCIDHKLKVVDDSRCVACLNCTEKCPKQAIRYGLPIKARAESSSRDLGAVGASRRQALSIAAVLASSTTAHAQKGKVEQADGGLALLKKKQAPNRTLPIVPAGAQSTHRFDHHCTACQLCVSVCPSQVLRPSSHVARLMQPEMSFERGYCRPECTKCSQVCPTGAIHRVTAEEKSAIQIGHAVWMRELCVANLDNVTCTTCARHCPVGAIRLIPKEPGSPNALRIPMVDAERCIGCGACENLCPSRPLSAMRVEGHERHRVV